MGMALVGIEGEKRNLILQANESLAEIIGTSVDDLVGTPTLRDLADPDDVERVSEGIASWTRERRRSFAASSGSCVRTAAACGWT